MRVTGVLDRLWKKWKPRQAVTCKNQTKSVLNLWNVMTAFMLLGSFMAISIMILFYELRVKIKKAFKM